MNRSDYERHLLVSAYRKCEAEGEPEQFWRFLRRATILARLCNEEKEDQAS